MLGFYTIHFLRGIFISGLYLRKRRNLVEPQEDVIITRNSMGPAEPSFFDTFSEL